MANRKYMTEFALNMYMSHDMLLQQDDLSKVSETNYFSKANPCHIYIICKRPRIVLNPKDFKIEHGKITFPFRVQKQNKFEDIYVEALYGDDPDIVLISDYPYNFYKIRKGDQTLQRGKTALLYQMLFQGDSSSTFLDLEVLYIGQSYGVSGARTAPDRLRSHSTLQGIYSEAIQRNPDSEIWLLLTSFEELLVTSIDGRMVIDPDLLEKDDKHVKKVTSCIFKEGLEEQQVINFTEAALIKYFQPQYNKEYKDTFPNPAHKTYAQCYDLDINSVCIEVNTEDINCKLYSIEVKPKWIHMKNFLLHAKEDRKSMFDF